MLRARGSVSPTNKMFAVFITDGQNKNIPVEIPKGCISLLKIPIGTKKIIIYSEDLRTVIKILFCGDEPHEDLGLNFFWNPLLHPSARLWEKKEYPTKIK